MDDTLPPAFSALFPVDMRSLKGKVIVVTLVLLLSLLEICFIIFAVLGYISIDNDCTDNILYWWIGSLLMEGILICLIVIFSFYIWKSTPQTNTGRDLYKEKKDPIGLSIVFSYLIIAVLTIGWNVTVIAYLVIQTITCVGSINFISIIFWIPITTFTAVIPTRVWKLLFCVPWDRITTTTYY